MVKKTDARHPHVIKMKGDKEWEQQFAMLQKLPRFLRRLFLGIFRGAVWWEKNCQKE